jgi:phosphotransferase system enzyme I (PtsI)
MTVSAADKAEIPVAICGGMAGDVRLTRLLIGMGFRELSMPAALLPEVKQAILTTNIESLQVHIKKILRSYDPLVIQECLQQLASVGSTLH